MKYLIVLCLTFSTYLTQAQSIFSKIDKTIENVDFTQISNNRRNELSLLADSIGDNRNVKIVFSSVMNSSSSQLYQIWLQVALFRNSISNVNTFSYGSSPTILDINTLKVLSKNGFKVSVIDNKCLVSYSWSANQLLIFPKKYDNYQLQFVETDVKPIIIHININETDNQIFSSLNIMNEMFYLVSKIKMFGILTKK